MDIAVTNWCDRGCEWCYRRSDTHGSHMSVEDYRMLIRQGANMGVLQVALGGGNPNQHPQFSSILEITRKEFGVVPSYTTNGRGLDRNVLDASRRFCGAVAVSAYAPYEEAAAAVRRLIANGIKTNVQFILSSDSVETAIDWLHDPPTWMKGINALIFLNFKPVTRDGNDAPLANKHLRAKELFGVATADDRRPFKIGFDDCCHTGLLAHGDPHPASIEACDSARFSMFVSERLRAYPCSFMAELCEGHLVTSHNLQDIWHHSELFVRMRDSLVTGRCSNCHSSGSCLSGCPLFPEMNFCGTVETPSPVRTAMQDEDLSVPLTVHGRPIV